MNCSTDGTEQFLVEYLSDEVNTSKHFRTKETGEKDDKFGKDNGCVKLMI